MVWACPRVLPPKKELKTDGEKREFLAQFCLDPSKYKGVAINETSVFLKNSEDTNGVWITEGEMGGPSYLNDKKLAEAIVKGKDLPERPHELPSLAKLDVKQYYFTKKYFRSSVGDSETSTVKKDGRVEATLSRNDH